MLQVRLRTLGADHPDTIDTRHSIARRLAERADYGAAESEYRGVLEVMQRVLGAEAPGTLMVHRNLAALVSFRGDYAQAEAEYRDVLAIKLRVLGRDHQDTLNQVLAVRQAKIPDHPDTLSTRHELARVLVARGNTPAAQAEFQAVLTAKIRVLGPDHPSTALTRREIESLTGGPDSAPTRHGKPPGEPGNWI